MSRFATLALGAALALAGTASAAANQAQCKAEYDAVATDFAATLDDKCAALVAYSKCLDGFPRDTKMEMELFEKNDKACNSHWIKVGTPKVHNVRGNLEVEVDDSKDTTFARPRRAAIKVTSIASNIDDLKEKNAAVQKELAAGIAELAAAKKELADQGADSAKKLEDKVIAALKKMQDSTDAAITQASTDAAALSKAVDGSVAQLKSDTTKQIDAAVAKTKSAVDKNAKAVADLGTKVNVDVKKSIDDSKKKMADKPIHIWSGMPRSHSRGENWANFILDYTDFNTAAPYFKQESSTHFRVQKAGVYEFTVNILTHTNGRCWAQFQINAGGQWINDPTHTYAHSWKQTSFTITYPIKAGMQVYSRVYVQPGCGNPYRWHQMKHSRWQMAYVGQYGAKCSGGRCII